LPLLIETESPSDGGTSLTPTGNVTTEEFVRDDALRLVFMCCHPSLSSEAQVALTLRLVCGVATPDIARCFLVSESTMAARLTRAKKKISVARIPFTVPRSADMPERLSAVLGVIYLLFTVGHTSPTGNQLLQTDAVAEAIRLARLLHDLVPNDPEVAGLLALLIVNDSRRASRLGEGGRSIRISEQDRSRWDQALIREARHLIDSHLGPRGQYALQAQIALLHAEAPTFDDVNWPLILRTYDELLSLTPSPVIELNRAVAVSKTQGSEVALGIVRRLETDGHLARSQYLPAVKAYLLDQLGRHDEANAERTHALGLTTNEVERAFLAKEIH
jgi:RNA polymerase sigma-70 factor (ECF subfamily)